MLIKRSYKGLDTNVMIIEIFYKNKIKIKQTIKNMSENTI